MAQNGMFRNAMGGFNKQDVLRYIDEITAAWDAERKALTEQAEAAQTAEAQLRSELRVAQEASQQAATAAEEALQQLQVAETQLAEVQQKLYDAEADLAGYRAAVEELTEQVDAAQGQIAAARTAADEAAAQRDEAIAAVADAKVQMQERTAAETQLEESRRENRQLRDQMDAMQQAISRYERVLGEAADAQERMSSLIHPFLEQANKQADETLDSVQAVLAGLLAQLGEVQGSVEQRRQALERCKEDSNTRLNAAFGDWLEPAKEAPADRRHFFR